MKYYLKKIFTGLVLALGLMAVIPTVANADWQYGNFNIQYQVAVMPTVTISANPTSIANGASSTLTWSSTNATSCTASNGWSGTKATSGTNVSTGALTTTTTFSITCTGAGGSTNASTTVTVAAVVTPAPTVIISADPTSITSGQSSALTWSSTNATSCTASNGWSGTKATSGTNVSTGVLNSTTTYTMTCSGAGGTSSIASATVTVSTVPLATVTISANPTSIANGASSTLTWSSTNAVSCTASNGWSGSVATSGSQSSGALSGTTTYTIMCKNSANVDSSPSSATVTVTDAPVPITPTGFTASPSNACANNWLNLSWNAVSGATSYTVKEGTRVVYTGTSTAMSDTGLTSGSSHTYTVTATNASGTSATASATGTVADPCPGAPTVSISVTPTSVASGASSTITWSSTNATSCTASNYWSGPKATSGSGGTGALTESPTYTLTCTGSGGTVNASATVTVTQAPITPVPALWFSSSPSVVNSGQSSTLYWSSENVTSCTAGGDWSDSKAISGNQSTGAVSSNKTYNLTCTGVYGTVNATAYVSIQSPLPIINLSATPTAIASGETSYLYYTVQNATSCTGSGSGAWWDGARNAQSDAFWTDPLTASTTFTLSCTGAGGTTTASVTVIVNGQPVAKKPWWKEF